MRPMKRVHVMCFLDWCEANGRDPESEESRQDFVRYLDQVRNR